MTARWIALILVLALLALLTTAATAVRSVSRIWLRHWAERRLVGSDVAEAYIDRPQRLLLGATAAATLLAAAAGMVIGAAPVPGWAIAADLAVFAAGMLLFGQYLPRAIGRRWAPQLVPVLLPALRAVTLLAAPVVALAQAVARAFERESDAAAPPSERDEIEDLLREGELEGIGEPDEIDFITGVVQFGDKVLRDVMTPRTEIFALDADMEPREMAHAIAQAGYSRVPVYRGTLDEVVGLVHALDVLSTGGEERPPLQEVMFAPESKRCSEMLFQMLRRQRHLAVVLDEFGGTAGIVTLEDVLEELVGDIRDEHDEPDASESGDATSAASRAGANRALLLRATTELDEVAERFGVELGNGRDGARAHTLGGALVRALGRIPAPGERFRFGPLEATVVESDATRIVSLLVQRSEGTVPVDVTLPG
ncbi:MAG TPA: hemolysin family protein [Gemmatimonadaceae bacterium]|nr:hemolysin family protein [Gemmatimonadaceae bacterium]